MKKLFVVSLFLVLFNCSFGQKIKSQIEVTPFTRYDKYPGFSYNLLGRASTDFLKMQGLSWGIDVNYKRLLIQHLYIKAGIGYYRYTFNKLDNLNSVFGNGDARFVDYPGPNFDLYLTHKYWYNNLSANIGLERSYNLKNDVLITTGVNWRHYFTYSKRFNIKYGSTGSDINTKYVVSDFRYFGNSINVQLAITKPIDKFFIGPYIIIPVYDYWKKDEKFDENEREGRKKWLGGLGVGITITKNI